ncbi:MAG: hypothetical protein HOD97_03640 [Candidatus Marinimicrobia bacterium]|nr:hypothetical protein [Candidatus Neomarinimicrobiota bacterium]MBT3617712.1 hypothetical protein [Candidatus Neomarinimicrobiota bacterium]MBT3828413.1 hypothetical protein [Candidatus Neomarinimicrobiota bacterium]MBT3997533.1 hypothetical protein [Candidatus Neomarinimicrobiota bacterium]MBT4280694.1 hypothetical protein [Candidatus Neomarinimicrobiota bacterium]
MSFTISLICAFSILSAQDSDRWELISLEREYSISGIGQLSKGMVVVHDNKQADQARIGFISDDNYYEQLNWPTASLPFDLEALDIYPGKTNQFIAMESSGKCYQLRYNPRNNRLILKNEFQIPGVKKPMNLEGIAIFTLSGNTWIAWGDRGKNQFPATLYWGRLNVYNSKVEPSGSHSFTVSFPESDVRHLSDMDIAKDGTCWVSSASDPGDDGPFDSAVYRLGQFKLDGTALKFIPENNGQLFKIYKGHKIEAITLENGRLICATDDENAGSSLLYQPIK